VRRVLQALSYRCSPRNSRSRKHRERRRLAWRMTSRSHPSRIQRVRQPGRSPSFQATTDFHVSDADGDPTDPMYDGGPRMEETSAQVPPPSSRQDLEPGTQDVQQTQTSQPLPPVPGSSHSVQDLQLTRAEERLRMSNMINSTTKVSATNFAFIMFISSIPMCHTYMRVSMWWGGCGDA
jgi:hypothetical protein